MIWRKARKAATVVFVDTKSGVAYSPKWLGRHSDSGVREMFWGAKKLVRDHRERFLSLVLLPAFFLGTIAHTECICGDGHREQFCTPGNCRQCLSRSSAANVSDHSCCKAHASHEKRSCCRIKPCKQPQADGAVNTSLAANNGCCCKAVIEVPAPVTVGKKSDLTGYSAVVAAIESVPDYVTANELWPSFDWIRHSTLPPVDAVIIYLHLTI
jgi:hypothetical protein